MWALPGVAAQVMEATQAGVMSTPAAKMSEIVASGMVDGFAGIPEMDASAMKVIRYAKFETVVPGGLTSPSFSLILNKQKWQEISPQDRAAIVSVSGEVFARRLSALDQVNSKALKKAEADGLKVSVASPSFVQQLLQAAEPIEQAWLKSAEASHVDGKAALAFYRHSVEENKK